MELIPKKTLNLLIYSLPIFIDTILVLHPQFQRGFVFNFLNLRLTIQRGSDEEGIWFRTPLGMESSGGPQEICIFYLIISLLQYSLKGSMQLHNQDNRQFNTFVS